MPNGWRPVGVADKYPITVLYNPKEQIKYHTHNSQVLIRWTWVQLLLTVVMIFHLFNNRDVHHILLISLLLHLFSY